MQSLRSELVPVTGCTLGHANASAVVPQVMDITIDEMTDEVRLESSLVITVIFDFPWPKPPQEAGGSRSSN